MRSTAPTIGICVGLFLVAAIPLVALNYDYGRAFFDQQTYHYPTIMHFAGGGGLGDYPAATTPGYHLLLASFARSVTSSELGLKLFNTMLTSVLLAAVAARVSRRVPAVHTGACLVLPMLFSIYVFPSGVWLLPDNLAWLTVLCGLLLAIDFRDGWRWYLLSGLTLAAAVLVRQSNLWLGACVLVAAGVHRETERKPVPLARRAARLAKAALAVLPSLLLALWFVWRWQGLTPPSFAQKHTGLNFAAAPFFLCVLFCYGVFYIPVVAMPAYRLLSVSRRHRLLVCAACLGGVMLSLLTPTDWNPAAGRISGLWNLARLTPEFHHRSTSISALAGLGSGLGALLLLMVDSNIRWVAGAAAGGFVTAQVASRFSYERYYAGFVFIFILLLLTEILRRTPGTVARGALAGPVVLAAINALVLAASLVP